MSDRWCAAQRSAASCRRAWHGAVECYARDAGGGQGTRSSSPSHAGFQVERLNASRRDLANSDASAVSYPNVTLCPSNPFRLRLYFRVNCIANPTLATFNPPTPSFLSLPW